MILKSTKMIRESNKPSILVANKGDIQGSEQNLNDFYELGFGEATIVSAEHGIKVNQLLDKIISFFPEECNEIEEEIKTKKVQTRGDPIVRFKD